MSYQVLHILSHGSSLRKERGQLVMYPGDGNGEKRCAIEDLRALIVAARGITFSSDLLSALCKADAVILHCDEKYRPCGLTAPLSHTTRTGLLARQCETDSALHRHLWNRILADKVENQSQVLRLLGAEHGIPRHPGEKVPDEAAAARYYWRQYFTALGIPDEIREQESGTPVNNMLNYGYAVLLALIHRSVVAHGMLPELGFHHCPSFGGYPLVYDLMEPFRPLMDFLLAQFIRRKGLQEQLFPEWCRYIARSLLEVTLETPQQRQKLLYAVDVFVEAAARCLEENSIKLYWGPRLEKQPVQNGLDHDDV